MKKLKKEKKAQQKSKDMDRGTIVEKNNVVINEVVSVEGSPKVETEEKTTSIEGIKTKNHSVITN